MKIAIAQINCVLGDLAGNSARIVEYAERARAQGADLMVTPELSLCGYPPEDLLLHPAFIDAQEAHLEKIVEASEGIFVVVGTVRRNPRRRRSPPPA